jgi:hypothetical protein
VETPSFRAGRSAVFLRFGLRDRQVEVVSVAVGPLDQPEVPVADALDHAVKRGDVEFSAIGKLGVISPLSD